MKILFFVTILFGLLNVIAGNEDVFEKMSLEERRSFFGTEDGSIPEYEVVELERTSRSERSTEEPVNITFNAFGTLLTASVYPVEDRDLISRRLTGVWFATSRQEAYQGVYYDPWPNIFDELGDFEFLHNPEEGSALTRFWDSNGNENIIGILKQNYTVKCVPVEFEYAFIDINRKHVLGKRSEKSPNDQEKKRLLLTIFKNSGVPQEYFRRHTYAKNDALPDPRLHRPRRQNTDSTTVPDVVYPKLLIIPDFNTVRRYPAYVDFFKELIAQLNSIDMMYRQLKDPEVHLNIAGVIIPYDDDVTPWIVRNTDPEGRINGDVAMDEANLHFWNEQRRFPHNGWDTLVMLSTDTIGTYDANQGDLVVVNGLSGLGQGCTGSAVFAKFTENMDGVYTLAHELGHMFGSLHDEEENKTLCKDVDGYLMVNGYGYAQKLEWSTCSRAAIQRFFRSEAGNCTYSRPDEIPSAVQTMQGAWLPMAGQCDNLYNDSTNFCTDNNPPPCIVYGCERNGTCDWILNSPMEGSLLDDDANGLRACINQNWVPVA